MYNAKFIMQQSLFNRYYIIYKVYLCTVLLYAHENPIETFKIYPLYKFLRTYFLDDNSTNSFIASQTFLIPLNISAHFIHKIT